MKFILALLAIIAMVYADGFGNELASMDFKNLLGGPMVAVIKAQALSAKTTVDFINDIGMITDENTGKKTIRTVSFDYSKATDNGTIKNFTLTVPFILLMPIPYIEINVLTVDLNVKLNSMTKDTRETKFDAYVETSGKSNFFVGSVSWKGGASYSSESKSTGKTEREYALNIHLQAGQAPLPKGTERILDMLESVIKEKKADA